MPVGPTFRFLSEADMLAAGVNDAARCVDVSDEVFRLLHAGDFLMGGPNGNNHGMGLVFPTASPFPNMPVAGPDRRFVAMPAYLGGRFDLCGNKWYGSNAANAGRGLPRSILTVTLNDKETGAPVGVLSANALSAARTGAVPAVATRYLPTAPPATIAVIGCGAINRAVLAALMSQHAATVTSIRCVNRSRGKAEAFAEWARAEFGVAVVVVDTAEECVCDADVVTVAASRTAPLHVQDSWFAPEATILLSGPMQANDELWTESRIVYDHVPLHHAYVEDARNAPDLMAAYMGTIGGPFYRLVDEGRLPALDDSEDLGTIIAEGTPPQPGRRNVFIACGMAVFDVAWGADVLAAAEAQGIGRVIDLWAPSAA